MWFIAFKTIPTVTLDIGLIEFLCAYAVVVLCAWVAMDHTRDRLTVKLSVYRTDRENTQQLLYTPTGVQIAIPTDLTISSSYVTFDIGWNITFPAQYYLQVDLLGPYKPSVYMYSILKDGNLTVNMRSKLKGVDYKLAKGTYFASITLLPCVYPKLEYLTSKNVNKVVDIPSEMKYDETPAQKNKDV